MGLDAEAQKAFRPKLKGFNAAKAFFDGDEAFFQMLRETTAAKPELQRSLDLMLPIVTRPKLGATEEGSAAATLSGAAEDDDEEEEKAEEDDEAMAPAATEADGMFALPDEDGDGEEEAAAEGADLEEQISSAEGRLRMLEEQTRRARAIADEKLRVLAQRRQELQQSKAEAQTAQQEAKEADDALSRMHGELEGLRKQRAEEAAAAAAAHRPSAEEEAAEAAAASPPGSLPAGRGEGRGGLSFRQKVAMIKTELGLDADLPSIAAIAEANAQMGLVGEGSLPMQVDALLAELG